MCVIPLFAASLLSNLAAFGMAALGLGFVIFVHELGHFLVAKLCGVKCEKFYVGFDVPIRIGPIQLPRALFRRKWGETEYGIGIIPLGGYVKMLGQDDNPANAAKEAERIRVAQEGSGQQSEDASYQLDPRSYPAKTVPQRLAIISAGVVMNLIFAVIFGMIAYRVGVTYTPTVVGGTSPGLSAWEVGLQAGDRILQMGRDGVRSDHLRFDKDMMVKVMMTGPNQELDLLVQRYLPPGTEPAEPEWITVQLSAPQESHNGRPMIGIAPAGTTTIAGTLEQRQEIFGHLPGGKTEPPLQAGDRVVAVDGVPVADYPQLSRALALGVDRPLKLDIERPAGARGDADDTERFSVELAVQPVRTVGLRLGMGPIAAFQRDSIGRKAGLELGDRIVAVNGEPISDPLMLPDIIRRLTDEDVELTVERGDSESPERRQVRVRPAEPTMLDLDPTQQLVAVQGLGLAYRVSNRVEDVVDGSPAARAGIRAGDLLQTAEFIAASPDSDAVDTELLGRPIRLGDEQLDWPRVHHLLQRSRPDTRLRLTYQRGDYLRTADLDPPPADDWFFADRGLGLSTLEEVHVADNWAAALGLGWRETIDSVRQVYFILYRLITGSFSPTNLGGPGTIVTMAGLEAAESPARLLVFLTLLSANLAVINFLPIPVLDGGHVMFLLYEGIFRKPVNERVAFGLTMLGFCFILGLMIFVIGLDVLRFSGLAG